ncbi:MAG: DUF1330 domain-containing protein [Acetobacteraceae bacterium]|nr:DUF1330 domain-containing protein [Acetobacteraceae bacterium]
MPAYVINDMEVTDPDLLEEYKKLSPATVQQFGGRFLARGGDLDVLEGEWRPQRLVILEFPSLAQAKAWANSAEYAPAKQIRQRASRSNIIVVDGAASTSFVRGDVA